MSTFIQEYIRLQEKTSVWRTRQGQEFKNFEVLHQHLHESSDALAAVFDEAFALFEAGSERSSELERDGQDSQIEPPISTSGERAGASALSGETLVPTLRKRYGKSYETIISRLHSSRNRFFEDRSLLIDQERTMAATRNKLLRFEYRLQTKQDQLKEAMDRAVEAYPQLQFSIPASTARESSQSSHSESRSTNSNSDTPALLREYHECRGRVQILKERLGEADYYHEEHRVQREMMADRGEALESTDADFEEDYRKHRKETEDELGQRVAKLEELELRCQHEGLSTNPVKAQSSIKSFAGDPEEMLAQDDEVETELLIGEGLVSKPLIQPISYLEIQDDLAEAPQTSGRVESWLDEIAAASTPLGLAGSASPNQISPAAASKGTSRQDVRLTRRRTFPGLNFPRIGSDGTIDPSTGVQSASLKLQALAADRKKDGRPLAIAEELIDNG